MFAVKEHGRLCRSMVLGLVEAALSQAVDGQPWQQLPFPDIWPPLPQVLKEEAQGQAKHAPAMLGKGRGKGRGNLHQEAGGVMMLVTPACIYHCHPPDSLACLHTLHSLKCLLSPHTWSGLHIHRLPAYTLHQL